MPDTNQKNPLIIDQAATLLSQLFAQLQIKITTSRSEEGDNYHLTFPELGKTFIFDRASGQYLGNINYIPPQNLPMPITGSALGLVFPPGVRGIVRQSNESPEEEQDVFKGSVRLGDLLPRGNVLGGLEMIEQLLSRFK